MKNIVYCFPDGKPQALTFSYDDGTIHDRRLVEIFNRFLATLPMNTRKIFVRRYWYLSPVKEIAADYSFSESKVKMTLLRTREKLRLRLKKEGIFL